MRMTVAILAVLWLSAAWACTGTPRTHPPLARLEGGEERYLPGQIVDLGREAVISFSQLIKRLRHCDLIFLGETHDHPEHHLIQVQILQALAESAGELTLAMEFFQAPQQPTVDRYLQHVTSEPEFIREVDWEGSWGFPYHLYRPLLLLARNRSWPVLAINAPREVVRKVARSGLKSLTPSERSRVAGEIDLGDRRHRAFVRRAYESHEHRELADFQYFYEAQCVWEDTMAEHIARRLKTKGGKVVVLCGNGHIAFKFGIPDRTIKRVPAAMATVALRPLPVSTTLEKGVADYAWLTAGQPVPAVTPMNGAAPSAR